MERSDGLRGEYRSHEQTTKRAKNEIAEVWHEKKRKTRRLPTVSILAQAFKETFAKLAVRS